MIPKANSNFQVLRGADLHDRDSPRYRAYRAAWYDNPATFTPGSFPLHLDIEPTNRCNLRCVFCDKLPALEGVPHGDMDYQTFVAIIEEASQHGLCGLKLSYRGEPLLHPRIADFVGLAKTKGVLDVYMNTNGMLLGQEMAARLMDAGLDRISVSVEGIEPAPFEAARRGASFLRIQENIEGLVALREKRGLAHPKVRVQTVRLPGLDLEAYGAYWSARADEVAVVDAKDGGVLATGLVRENWACPQPYQRLTIDWQGTVLPCNNDDRYRMPLGRTPFTSLAELWSGHAMNRLRDLHRSGLSHLAAPCDGCPWRTTQIAKSATEEP